MRVCLKFLFVIISAIIIFSCNDVSNPSEIEIINKSISPQNSEQILQSGSDFKIIIPANSMNGDLDIKVLKLNTQPIFNIPKYKLGQNIYKLTFKGNCTFKNNVFVSINYNPLLIPKNSNAGLSVKGFIHSKNLWKDANYSIDESNNKIIFKVTEFETSKIQKNTDDLLDSEGEIIFGDGYSTTDEGNKDDSLYKYNKINFELHIGCNRFQWSSKNQNKYKSTIMEWYSDSYNMSYKGNGRFEIKYDTTWQWSNGGENNVTTNKVVDGYIQLNSDLHNLTEYKLKILEKSNYTDGSNIKYEYNFTLSDLPAYSEPFESHDYLSYGIKPSVFLNIFYPCEKNYITLFEYYRETNWASNNGTIDYDQSIFECSVCDSATSKVKNGYDEQMCSLIINIKK